MRISDWSSDVCSSDLSWRARSRWVWVLAWGPVIHWLSPSALAICPSRDVASFRVTYGLTRVCWAKKTTIAACASCSLMHVVTLIPAFRSLPIPGSEEHTSELQSLMRFAYSVFRLTKKKQHHHYPP